MAGGLVGELVLLTGPERGLGLFLHIGQFYLVGSMESCDLGVEGRGISERHCRIMVGSGLLTLEDLRSDAGTLLNGQKIQLASLSFGDHIRVGDQVIRVDERKDAKAPPKPTATPVGECERCGGPVVRGEFHRSDLFDTMKGRLCSPCAESESGPLVDDAAAAVEAPQEVVGGRYALVAKVGSGQLGTVWEAFDGRSNTTVAIKILDRRFKDDPVSFGRLIEMGRRVMHLQHPWVARPIRIGDDPSGCYLASEFVEGEDLWRCLERGGPFDVEKTIRFGIALADALELIHVRGMVHGDLKPSNLVLVGGDRVKITDVGIARACLGTGLVVVGENLIPRTLAFHAPELLLEEREADVFGDVYSLGAVLYTLLSGDHPYSEHPAKELPRRIVIDRPTPLRRRRPEVPEALAAVVERAMDKSPAARYPSAGEMGQALMEAWS